MKSILIIIQLLLAFNLSAQNEEYLRENFIKSVKDKAVCARMIAELKDGQLSDTELAYLGGFQTIWAKHIINPIEKLSTFKKGKNNINNAIKNESENIDIRMIRLSIQKSAPRFLNYSENIEQDTKWLKEKIPYQKSTLLNSMITDLINTK